MIHRHDYDRDVFHTHIICYMRQKQFTPLCFTETCSQNMFTKHVHILIIQVIFSTGSPILDYQIMFQSSTTKLVISVFTLLLVIKLPVKLKIAYE